MTDRRHAPEDGHRRQAVDRRSEGARDRRQGIHGERRSGERTDRRTELPWASTAAAEGWDLFEAHTLERGVRYEIECAVEDGHKSFASDLAALLHVVGKAARDEEGAHYAALAYWHRKDPVSYVEDMNVVMEFLPGDLHVMSGERVSSSFIAGDIRCRIAKFDSDSNLDEYTETSDVWDILHWIYQRLGGDTRDLT